MDTVKRSGIELTGDLILNLGDFINEAIDGIQSVKSYWFMQNSATCALVAGQRNYSISTAAPTGFGIAKYKDPVVLYYTNNGTRYEIKEIGETDVLKYYGATDEGDPCHYIIRGDNIEIYPLPETVYTMTFINYKKFADLSADADTNTLTTDSSALVLYKALSDVFTFLLRPDIAKLYSDMAVKEERDLNAMDLARKLPRDMMLIPRADAFGSGLTKSYPKVLGDYY
jgi:hypothetical protein